MQDELLNAEYNESGKSIKCVVLASFSMMQSELVLKKLLFFKWHKKIKKMRSCFLIFIPWKHSMKEIKIVSAEKITVNDHYASGFIQVDKYISHFTEELPYTDRFQIKGFNGFDFVYKNNDFIANVYEQCCEGPLSALYQAKPELLQIEINEE